MEYSIINATNTPKGETISIEGRWSIFKIKSNNVTIEVDGFTNQSIPGVAASVFQTSLANFDSMLNQTYDKIVYRRKTVKTNAINGTVEQAYKSFNSDKTITTVELYRKSRILLSRSRK